MHNPWFWARHIQSVIIPHFELLEKTFDRKILPAFETIESEAEQLSDEKWEQLIHQPGDPDRDPEGVLSAMAEEAEEGGISYYITMMGIRQGLINIFAVGIWHLFEQELLFIHRKELLSPQEENNAKLFELSGITRRLQQTGIDIKKFRSWDKLKELSLAANTVKHADGRSSALLKKQRPDIFIPPDDFNGPFWGYTSPPAQVFKPLAGEDLYLTPAEIRSYFQAVKDFWEELIENLRKGGS